MSNSRPLVSKKKSVPEEENPTQKWERTKDIDPINRKDVFKWISFTRSNLTSGNTTISMILGNVATGSGTMHTWGSMRLIRLDWDIAISPLATTNGRSHGVWAISVYEQGYNPGILDADDSNATTLPEQEAIATGAWNIDTTNGRIARFRGTTYSKRYINNFDNIAIAMLRELDNVVLSGIFTVYLDTKQ